MKTVVTGAEEAILYPVTEVIICGIGVVIYLWSEIWLKGQWRIGFSIVQGYLW